MGKLKSNLRKRKVYAHAANRPHKGGRSTFTMIPGTNYMGVGHPWPSNGPAQTANDEFSYGHDDDYEYAEAQLKSEGSDINPKFAWIQGIDIGRGDDHYLEQLEDGFDATLARTFFGLKRTAAQVGLIPTVQLKKPKGMSFGNMRGQVNIVDDDMTGETGTEVARLSTATTSAKTNSAEEVTPVAPIYRTVTHPFQEHVNVVLPYKKIMFGKNITNSAGPGFEASDVYSFTFRLNSPTDIFYEYSHTNDPQPTSDTLGASTIQSPMYWKYWSTFYRYYTVTKTEYKITIVPGGDAGQRASVWTYHHGIQGPPIRAGSNATISDTLRSFHRHARCTPVKSRSCAADFRNVVDMQRTIEGVYRPGRHSVQNDIVEDDMAQTWHQVGSVPPLRELCTVVVQKPDDVLKGQGNAFIFNVILEMQLHIQMRDLYERYDYPHPTGDYTNLPLINGFALQPDTFYET